MLMNEISFQAYLNRLDIDGPLEKSEATLRYLHKTHLLKVPFENLDIQWGRPLSLHHSDLFDKIVTNQRGGFCYEMNHLFSALLGYLGFKVQMIAAQVHNEDGPGNYFDHMALIVDDQWLCDVGFGGGSFVHPLAMTVNGVQDDPGGSFKVEQLGANSWVVQSKLKASDPFTPVYYFDLIARNVEEFEAECRSKQQDPDSPFVTRKICTMATDTGRVTLLNQELTIRTGAQKKVIEIDSPQQEKQLLKRYFNIQSPI